MKTCHERPQSAPRSGSQNMQRDYCENVTKFSKLEDTRRDTHEIRKFFPTGNTKKTFQFFFGKVAYCRKNRRFPFCQTKSQKNPEIVEKVRKYFQI